VLKVFIATPAYEGKVHSSFAQSILLAGYDLAKCGIELNCSIVKNGIFIDVARSVMVKQFLETDCTHLMFIDSDLQFDPHAVASLVGSGLPLCGGIYRQREEKLHYIAKLHNDSIVYRDGWIRADRMATGFMCIERHVLEVMSERARIFILNRAECPLVFEIKHSEPDKPGGPRGFVGEDFAFCDDYMKLYNEGVFDEPIWVWPDIDFVHDIYPCNFHQFLLEKGKE